MKKKIIWSILVVLLVLVLGGLMVFKLFIAQGVTPSYDINQPTDGRQSVLIATQKKDFKNKVMQQIADYYQDKAVYIKVIDVTKLGDIKGEEWDKIVIFTTTEMGKVPATVTGFLEKQSDFSNIFMPVTAASGQWNGNKLDVDVVATASKTDNVRKTADGIIAFIGEQ